MVDFQQEGVLWELMLLLAQFVPFGARCLTGATTSHVENGKHGFFFVFQVVDHGGEVVVALLVHFIMEDRASMHCLSFIYCIYKRNE